MHRMSLWLSLILCPVLFGCGPKGPVMVPVTGTVTLDGSPMPDGVVYFKTIIEGSVDELPVKDGKFNGMVEVGDRRVEICRYGLGPPIKMGGGEIPNRIETLPARYNYESELKASVKEEGSHDFKFEVTSK
jgi:hypothetical protein